DEAREVIARQSQRLALALDDVRQLGRLVGPGNGSRVDEVDVVALLRACGLQVSGDCAQLTVATDGAQLQDVIERTLREAPARPRASIDADEKEAATHFTLEPVGGGFGVQLLRAVLERAGAQVSLLQGTQGRRVAARFPRQG
ncbi:MAG TPA: hypothetical protein VIE63_07780, partial [Ramlibacter sp.]